MPQIIATTSTQRNTLPENYRGSRDFQPSNRNAPCPVCGNTSGKCRVMASSDLVLCMTHQEELPGWKYLGVDDKQGLWGKYFPDNPNYRPTYTPEVKQSDPLVEWNPEEWDQHNSRIIRQSPLTERDRADILNRLNRAGLEPVYLDYIPGASLSSGYLIPCPNPAGQLLRGQIRYRGENIEGGRYRWQMPNDGIDGHINGEMPVGCWVPVFPLPCPPPKPVDLILTEGTGIKPFITAQIFEIPTIGAAGGNHASSPKAMRAAVGGAKSVAIAVDAGAIHNHHVLSQYRKACAMLLGWGIDVKFLWWGQESKDGLDVDEGIDLSSVQWLSPDEFWALAQPTDGSFKDLARGPLAFLGKTLGRVLERSHKRAHRVERAATKREPRQPDLVFAPGDRLSAINAAIAQGYTHILDSSITGSGKSHFVGEMDPEDFGARQLIYISDEHRNPTTDTLKDWHDLESRHNGLVREQLADGTVRLRRATGDSQLSVLPNCSRVPLIEALRGRGVAGVDAAGTICTGCPVREKCAMAVGDGFGYIHQRRVLKYPRFRAHPDSLPLDYDLSKTVVFWDEMGKSFTANTVTTITLDDFAVVANYLTERGHTDMARELIVIRDSIAAMTQERDVHGVGFDKIRAGFAGYNFGNLDPLRVDEALDPSLEFLNPTAAHGVDVKDLPPALRKQMAGSGVTDAMAIPPQFFGNLLRILTGKIPGGSCRVNKQGVFEVSVPNPHHRAIATGAQVIIALDATLSKADYALKAGISPDQVFEIREQHAPMANLTVKQITDIGYCGQQRGDDKQRRIDAAVNAIQSLAPGAPKIDFKLHKADGSWFVDTRGVNIWQTQNTLILVGTPTANLGAVYAEWLALLVRYEPMDCPAFEQYLRGKTDAELVQGFGRLRANRRPDEQLTIWHISSHDISPLQAELGFNLVEMAGADLTIEAAPKEHRVLNRMLTFAGQLIESGKFCSQKIVAQLCGLTEGRISQIAKRYYGGWKKFVKAVRVLLFGEQIAETLDPEQSEIAQTLADMLTASLEDTEDETAQLVAELLDGFGILYSHAVDRLTDQTRAYLAARLILLT